MEYVEGHTLDAELKKRGRFTAAEALEVLEPIMSVLEHGARDGCGPSRSETGKHHDRQGATGGEPAVKLLDLGIAKMREIAGVESSGTTELTMAGQVLGTPYYMSPEQWGEIPRDRQSLRLTARADIYSLGLVFYEMITGRRCYSGTTLSELRRDHVVTVAKPLHEVAPNVPRGFSDAIQRATAKDRADRQPTASVLAAELKAGLTTASSGIQPTPILAETISTSDQIQTNSDVNAPTVIGLDASNTSVPGGAPATSAPSPVAPSPTPANTPADVSMSSPTMVEHVHPGCRV